MKLKIFSWNVRGRNEGDKHKIIKSMIWSYLADLVRLQETKVQQMNDSLVKSLRVGRCLNWGVVEASGQAGSILVFWDNRVLELIEMELGAFSVSCRFRNCEDNFVWMFTGVYGPILVEEREDFWDELSAIRGLWNDPWCVGGDLIVVTFLEERKSCQRLLAFMRRFFTVHLGDVS